MVREDDDINIYAFCMSDPTADEPSIKDLIWERWCRTLKTGRLPPQGFIFVLGRIDSQGQLPPDDGTRNNSRTVVPGVNQSIISQELLS